MKISQGVNGQFQFHEDMTIQEIVEAMWEGVEDRRDKKLVVYYSPEDDSIWIKTWEGFNHGQSVKLGDL